MPIVRSACPPFPRAFRWECDCLRLLDQRRLPAEEVWIDCRTLADVVTAIRTLAVRGAPLIGVAAAYGMVLAAKTYRRLSFEDRIRSLTQDLEVLACARPTAVNLIAAVKYMHHVLERHSGDGLEVRFLEAANELARREEDSSWAMAITGATHLSTGSRVLTHCNTGSLATPGPGTALGVIRCAWAGNALQSVACTETRPWGQGLRLTTYELSYSRIPVTLYTESAAGAALLEGTFDWLIVGADRISRRGDVLNKIGTHMLARLARLGGARVMVVAPTTTVDPHWDGRTRGPIEERDGLELWQGLGMGPPPHGLRIANPVFDETPAEAIDLIVTERGAAAPGDGALDIVLGLEEHASSPS